MTTLRRLLLPVLALAAGAFATAAEPSPPSCVVDVGAALTAQPKTTDTIPLAAGEWIGGVYVLPYSYPDTYDRSLPSGADNVAARQWVAQSFFAYNPDAYDFIAVVTGFEFNAGWGQHGDPTHALYWGIRNDVTGLGLPFFDHSTAFGSSRIQGLIDANSLDLVRDSDGELDEDHLLTVVSHELGHRWLAYCDFETADGQTSGALRGVDGGHWSYLLDSDASVMYGADWTDNGDGTFTAAAVKARYSDLDLYLMGVLDPGEVAPFTLLDNPAIAADQYPELGVTVTAAPTTIDVAQVIAAEGPRIPSAAEARRELRIAFVYLAAPGSVPMTEELDFLDRAAQSWKRRFFAHTEGRGVLGVGRNSLPVAGPPSVHLEAAIAWLLDATDASGLWADHPTTRQRDSAAVVDALSIYGGHAAEIAAALDALASAPSAAVEVEAWRAGALAAHGHPDATAALDGLLAITLDHGELGGSVRYAGDAATTARIVRTLAAAGRNDEAAPAIGWLESRQSPDGGWPWRTGGPSATAPTLEVVAAMAETGATSGSSSTVADAVGWLLAHRSQGGFGDPYPDVIQTAAFLRASGALGVSSDVVNGAISFLVTRQRTDGSWGGSVFETALAVAALAPFVQPDLAVDSSEIFVEPEQPYPDDTLTLTAAVHADNAGVPPGVRYRWDVAGASGDVVATIEGLLPAISASLFATVTDTVNLEHLVHPGTYTLRFVVDPLDELVERDEGNNAGELEITFRQHSGWIDLVLDPGEIVADPPYLTSVPQPLLVAGTVRNDGIGEARDAVIAVVDQATSTVLGTSSVTVPGLGEVSFAVAVSLDQPRDHDLVVVADPDDLLGDADPSNNSAPLRVRVQPSFDPGLRPDSLALTPATGVVAGDEVAIGFDLVNRGTEEITAVQVGVSYEAGQPPVRTPITLLQIDDALAPGAVRSESLVWRPPTPDPAMRIIVEVDPNHLVDDADRNNNNDEAVIAVAAGTLPNLVADHTVISVDPAPALQHQTATISALVTNRSDNPAGPCVARLWIDEIDTGVLVAEVAIPPLSAGGETVVEAGWTVDGTDDRLVWLDIDPADAVPEFDEGDNRDFIVLDVSSIPDLVVTSGQLTTTPRFPRSGDLVQVEARVVNVGDQPATDIAVELEVLDLGVVGSATIPTLAGGQTAAVIFDWSTAGIVGDHRLRVTADPADLVNELDEENNAAEIALSVQDEDLWVSERYISPNGDGIRDETTIFVRRPVTEIRLADPWGEIVRTLPVPADGAVDWDGRSDSGGVVRDGVYEILAGALTTWVEVDLNAVAITDDVQQQLITFNIAPLSTHPSAGFRSSVRSPIDGVVAFVEWTGSENRLRRWDGTKLTDVSEWPEEHTYLRQMSADERVFTTGLFTPSLLVFPGPRIDELIAPFPGGKPSLSPNGKWILWVGGDLSWGQSIALQRVDDLSIAATYGPYPAGASAFWEPATTVNWTLDGLRAVVTMHVGPGDSQGGFDLAVDIDLTGVPTAREVVLDAGCPDSFADIDNVPAASVDFSAQELICLDSWSNELVVVDLIDGSLEERVTLPTQGLDLNRVWYRVSNDGRAVEVDEYQIELLKDYDPSPYLILDWRRGISSPWHTAGCLDPCRVDRWSRSDRFYFFEGNETYLAPAANLTAILDPVVRFGGAGIDLFLTVSDRNLDYFLIEAAPAANPEAFEPIGQPSRDQLIGESWGTWIPPAAGSWQLRLTAVDRAGNVRSTTRWISWNGVSDIAGLWTESRHISPLASPGVRDRLVWRYTVLRPSQLLFEIADAGGDTIRTIPVGAAQTGPTTSSWDGLDDAGRPVPDGEYRLRFRGAEWPVIVDNTPPDVVLEIGGNRLRPSAAEIATAAGWTPPVYLVRSALFSLVDREVADAHLEESTFEARHVDGDQWAPFHSEPETGSEWFSERVLRLTAVDRAGNVSVVERMHREEQLAFAVAEPACRRATPPCSTADRPAIDVLRDQDGLLSEPAAVLWPDYTTLMVQSTVWGEWRDSLRLEFRSAGDAGLPPGDWQPGTLTPAEQPVRREVTALSDSGLVVFETLRAQVLPVYWEHPDLPLRPYEIRLIAENRDGVEIVSPITLLSPKAPLVIEHLATDSAGDHFRVHNVGTVRLAGITLFGSADADSWWSVTEIGLLEPGHSTLVTTGCAFLDRAIAGEAAGWVRAQGIDPWGAIQVSLPAPLPRAGPPAAVSHPAFSLLPGSCDPDAAPPIGMTGWNLTQVGMSPCASWSCALGWHSPGGLVDLRIDVPAVDPSGAAVAGYELLIDGTVVAGAPDLLPGATGRVVLDLAPLAEGEHVVSERYLFAPGDDGLLAGCGRSAVLHIDRTASLNILNPTPGQSFCPDDGLVGIETDFTDQAGSMSYLIDGASTGIGHSPTPDEPVIVLSQLETGPHTLSAEIVDLAGNAACASVDFVNGGVAVVSGLVIDPPVFSPTNTSGRPTETTVSFEATAPATFVAEIRDQWGDFIIQATGVVSPGSPAVLVWDGTDGDDPVADGTYEVWIRLESDCGGVWQTVASQHSVTLDTEGPTVMITSPEPSAWVLTALELRGLLTDPHFESWRARIRRQLPPGDWFVFADGERQSHDPNAVLDRFAVTSMIAGPYVVEVEAVDVAGNTTVTDPIAITLGERSTIARFDATPIYISPNGDGAADATELGFELLLPVEAAVRCYDTADILELLPPTFLPAAVPHTVIWDGADNDGLTVEDGAYRFSLETFDPGAGDEGDSEEATVVIDTAPPDVVITSPADGQLTATPLTVSGLTSDLHPGEYSVVLVRPDGMVTTLASDTGSWSTDDEITVENLDDGAYIVEVTAGDLALNTTTASHAFTVDNTAPMVSITAPRNGAVIDPSVAPITLRGSVQAAHPRDYAWSIAEGAAPDPADFVLLDQQPLSAAGDVVYPWAAPLPADGTHTIRLAAADRLDRETEARVVMVVDTTDPQVSITTPVAGAVITEPVTVAGTVADANLAHWTLEAVAADGSTTTIAAGATAVDGDLAAWAPAVDGPVTLVLTAVDRAGRRGRTSVDVDIAIEPPGRPQTPTIEVVNGRDVHLSWSAGPGPAPAGYHVARNGDRITAAPVAVPELVDPGLADAVYSYTVTAVGPLGRESDPSEPAIAVVNASPPAIALDAPSAGQRLGGEVVVHGAAFAADDFGFWEVAARPAGVADWIVIDGSTAPVPGGQLALWNTHLPPWTDGAHELRLAAEDTVGNRAEIVIPLVLDNSGPDPGPANLQAELLALDPDGRSNDVRLTWVQAPSPPDLAGFLLYRDGLLANAPGPVVGDHTPYLIHETGYIDRDVADGVYTYTVAAADTAGNLSTLSNPAGPITIDTRRPSAVVVTPADGASLEGPFEVVAECPDTDVTALVIEVRAAGQTDWTALTAPLAGPPYRAVFDPPALGDYELRAVAADAVGPDPAPLAITVTAADLPPESPVAVTVRVEGDDVVIGWIAPPDPAGDLAGFHVVRDGVQITADLLPPSTLAYLDTVTRDDVYRYSVAAVDDGGQQTASAPIAAPVTSPVWSWIEPVTWHHQATLSGAGAYPGGTVEISRQGLGGTPSVVDVVPVEPDGTFELDDIDLEPGATAFLARSIDSEGHLSRTSMPLLVVSTQHPATPADLTAFPDSGDVQLTWRSPPNPDGAGFSVARDGVTVNEIPAAVGYDPALHSLDASAGTASDWASVVDGDPATGWTADGFVSAGRPAWWTWSWPTPFEIDGIEITWTAAEPPQSFDVDLLTSGGWLWLRDVAWDGSPTTVLAPGVTASGIRIRVPQPGPCGTGACPPRLAEVAITRVDRTLDPSWIDHGVSDGVHRYEVAQHGRWGLVSSFASASVAVGPGEPLPPTAVTASPRQCLGVELAWSPTTTQPGTLIGHRVYASAPAVGSWEFVRWAGTTGSTVVDDAPVGVERDYAVSSIVESAGVWTESRLSEIVSATAVCDDPPPPVITQPTVAGAPITVTPAQLPITVLGTAVPGSTITLLRNGTPIRSQPAGYTFGFSGIEVDAGVTTFVARQTLGVHVDSSEPIEVVLDPSSLPDFELASFVVTPASASTGGLVMAEAVVAATGPAEPIPPVDVVFDLESPDGSVTEVFRTTVQPAAGESTVIRAPWTADAVSGRYTWHVTVDPDDAVTEADEGNNAAAAVIRVADPGTVGIDVVLDHGLYHLGQRLTGTVTVFSTAAPADTLVEVTMVDSAGRPVAVLETRLLPGFGDELLSIDVDHALVGLYPGLYRVRAVARVDDAVVAEAATPFRIDESWLVTAAVRTDRSSVAAGEPVTAIGEIRNIGPNPVADLVATVTFIDQIDGAVVDTAVLPGITVGADGAVELAHAWSTIGAVPGPYRVELEVRHSTGARLAAATPAAFTVVAGDLRLAAAVELSPSRVEPGDPAEAAVTVRNNGSGDLGAVDLAIRLVDPAALQVVDEHHHPVVLPAGVDVAVTQLLDTTGLGLGPAVVLIAASGSNGGIGFDTVIASATLSLADLTPPEIEVLEPSGSGVACGAVDVEAVITDRLSRVTDVWHTLDGGGETITLHRSDPALDPHRWVTTTTLPDGPDGSHTITVFAADEAGNAAAGVDAAFVADTTPPVLDVVGPANGSCAATDQTFTITAADLTLATVTATIDGLPYTSGGTIAAEGPHLLEVAAVDGCGRTTQEIRSFIIDRTVPEIAVVGVAQGDQVPPGTVLEWSVTDANLISATATFDGAAVTSPLTLVATGPHSLHVTGTDCAGNSADQTVTFEVVEAVLALDGALTTAPAVLEPGWPLRLTGEINNAGTDLDSVELELRVTHVASSTVVSSHSETVALAAGATRLVEVEPATGGWPLGGYEVEWLSRGDFLGDPFEIVLATQALTLADLTAPQLTITSPSPGLACDDPTLVVDAVDTLTGVATVSAVIDLGAPLTLTPLGGATWTAAPALSQGPHQITVTAVDGAGNQTVPVMLAIDLDTEAPQLSVAAPNDGACIAEPAVIEFSSDDAHPAGLSGRLDGVAIGSGAIVDTDGEHNLEIVAVDLCGRDSSDERRFILDTVDPAITIDGVADGETHVVGVSVAWSVDDDTPLSTSATLDGDPVAPVFVVDAPGPHELRVTAEDCAGNTTQRSLSFEALAAADGIEGSLDVAGAQVEPPDVLDVTATVVNRTVTGYPDVTLTLRLVDPATAVVIAEDSVVVDVTPSAPAVIGHTFATDGLALGDYDVVLRASGVVQGHAFDVALDTESVAVVDRTPPTIEVLAPPAGLVCTPVEVRVRATDAVSGVASVGVTLDDDPTVIALQQAGGDLWSVALAVDDGIHALEITAADSAGNPTAPIALEIDLDTEAPALVVSAPIDGACLGAPAVIDFDVVDAHPEQLSAVLDGAPISSGAVVSTDGAHTLRIEATDACGRTDRHVAAFVIDTTDPEIAVHGIAPGDELPLPVVLDWTVTDANLVVQHATLNGTAVASGAVIEAAGAYELIIDAADCADNRASAAVSFTVVEPDGSDPTVRASIDAGGSVLLLDRSAGGDAELQRWLAGRSGRLARVSDVCSFIGELRRGRHELVVLYAPEAGAAPLNPSVCSGMPELETLAAELSATAYRRGSIVVVGNGMTGDGCLGCLLDAHGSIFRSHTVDSLQVEGATSLLTPDGPTTLHSVRPLDLDGGFATLTEPDGGMPICNGLLALELTVPIEIDGPWSVDAEASTPQQRLDREVGALDDGGELDHAVAERVDLAASRLGNTLAISLRSVLGDPLPQWTAVRLSVTPADDPSSAAAQAAAWIPGDCLVQPGDDLGPFVVSLTDELRRSAEDTVAASGRRYGRADAFVLPWNVADPVNEDARAVAGQAIDFALSREPWAVVDGLPTPVSFDLRNPLTAPVDVSLEVSVPAGSLLDAWGDPVDLDPIRWEIELDHNAVATRTIWLMPTIAGSPITIDFELYVNDGDERRLVDSGELNLEVAGADLRAMLRRARAAIDACADSTDDGCTIEALRTVRSHLAVVAESGDDRDGIEASLGALARAFDTIRDERLPCLAIVRDDLAELVVHLQARWIVVGGGS